MSGFKKTHRKHIANLYNPKEFKKYDKKYIYAIIATDFGIINENYVETIRRFIIRRTERRQEYKCEVQLYLKTTKKPDHARMGRGGRRPSRKIGYVKPGKILFVFGELKEDFQLRHVRRVETKLPFTCKVVQMVKTNFRNRRKY